MAKKDRTEDLVKDLIHEEDWKRMNATAELLKRGPEAVRHLIAKGLSDGNARLRTEAVKMLGRIKDRTAGLPTVQLLKDPDPEVREAVTEAVGHVADAAALRALVQLLEDEATRDVASEVLGRLKDPAAMEPLVAMMKSQDPMARRMAAEALEQLADPRSVDAWVEAMAYPDLLDIASRSLKRISDLRDRITEILDRLRDIEDTVALEEARIGVSMDLIALGRPAVTELLEALNDELWVVREAAAQALGIIGDLRAVEPLIEILQGIGIYQKGTPTPGCIVSEEWFVREEAAKALGHFNDTRSVPALLFALKDTRLREKASGALVELGPQVIDQLVDFYNDPEASYVEKHNENIMSFATNRLDAQAWLRASVLDILTQLGWTPPEESAREETPEKAAGDKT